MNAEDRCLVNSDGKFKALLICVLLVTLICMVYAQVREFEFVNFDDTDYVSNNINIQKGITGESIIWAFTTVHAANWHPVTWLSHMVDYSLFGMDPGMHHLSSLFLHIINTLLLFFVFRKMTGGLWQSAFVAAMFGLHPLHVESVAWVSERKDVLSTFFWLLTMGCYAAYVFRPTVLKYLAMAAMFALGLMSKPMLVTLPCVLLLLDYWPFKRFQFQAPAGNNYSKNSSVRKLIWEKMPLFALAAVSCAVTYYAQKHGGAVKSFDYIPLADRIANAMVSYAVYIGKMLYPVRLALLYPHPEALPWWSVLGACLLLLAVTGFVVRLAKTYPYLVVGWLWYLGTLVPVIGLIQVGGQAMADRYMYIPMTGLLIMIAWGAPEWIRSWKYRNVLLASVAVVLVAVSSALAWKQAGYWKNSMTLFERALDVTENNYTMNYNLGNVMAEKGQIDAAKKYYLQALEIKPDSAPAYNNLGNLFLQENNPEAAIERYLKVMAINPEYPGARYNLAIALDDQGRTEEAVPYFLAALKYMPENADAYFKTANALFKTGDNEGAIRHYQQAVRINPEFVNAHCNLGVALFRTGDVGGSIAAFNEALRLQPNLKPARLYLQKAMAVQSKNK